MYCNIHTIYTKYSGLFEVYFAYLIIRVIEIKSKIFFLYKHLVYDSISTIKLIESKSRSIIIYQYIIKQVKYDSYLRYAIKKRLLKQV